MNGRIVKMCKASLLSLSRQLLQSTTESDLFLPRAGVDSQDKRLRVSRNFKYAANFTDLHKHLMKDSTEIYKEISRQLSAGLHRWMKFLSLVVKDSPASVPEWTYEELFKQFMRAFYIDCVHGSMVNLRIPYKDGKQVSSVPNIIFVQGDGFSLFSGVVQVKRMALDPAFKHAFEETPVEGILREVPSPAKKKCTYVSVDEKSSKENSLETSLETSRASSEETSEDENNGSSQKNVSFAESVAGEEFDYSDYDENEPSSSRSGSEIKVSKLPEHLRKLIQIFFGQLFGSVLALDCHKASEVKRQLGIGVVGFRVIFFAFCPRPNISFKDIPGQQQSKIEVYMTRPLSLLIAKERKEIAKIALLIAAEDPLYIH